MTGSHWPLTVILWSSSSIMEEPGVQWLTRISSFKISNVARKKWLCQIVNTVLITEKLIISQSNSNIWKV